jgi:hypothetical protein
MIDVIDVSSAFGIVSRYRLIEGAAIGYMTDGQSGGADLLWITASPLAS